MAPESRNRRLIDHLTQHWFLWFSVLYGLYVSLPWLAPVLMHFRAPLPARIIYTIYSFLCHQLPERSFFLFGEKVMYSLAEIQARWQPTYDPMILRQYIGDPGAGWKVAWSDRMASMYTSILLFAWLWWAMRKKVRPVNLLGFILLALPMAVDGTSHLISDILGMYQGFRVTNAWLVALTHNAFPGWFYVGDALGSFNSWMRLISGALFGFGLAWFLFPIIEGGVSADRLLKQARRDLMERLLEGRLAGVGGTAPRDPSPSSAVHLKD